MSSEIKDTNTWNDLNTKQENGVYVITYTGPYKIGWLVRRQKSAPYPRGAEVANIQVCFQTQYVEEEEPPIPTKNPCPISPQRAVHDVMVQW